MRQRLAGYSYHIGIMQSDLQYHAQELWFLDRLHAEEHEWTNTKPNVGETFAQIETGIYARPLYALVHCKSAKYSSWM